MEGSRESSSTGIIEKIVRTNEHDAYIKGYPDNTVKPDGNLTIAEAAAMIYRLLEINATTIESKFSDVADEWFATYVNQLANMNVVNGYEDGSFKPNNNVSRAEFTKMISSFSKLVSSKSVSLVDIENHWANYELVEATNNHECYSNASVLRDENYIKIK